jgi:hypothetical protein
MTSGKPEVSWLGEAAERAPALVRTELGLPGLRWLGPGDGRLLVELVRACYGDTYSYAALYHAEEIEALWARGSLLSLGHLDDDGRLDGHTGFWRKDPNGEYVESGVSLVHPGARRGFGVDPAQMWQALLERWSSAAAFIHQNTTTRHAHAQLHAARHMRARPTGWIFDYALGEALVGLAEMPAPMHALTMSTMLHPSAPALAVPEGPWAAWLAELLRGVLPAVDVAVVPCSPTIGRLALEPIEHNPSLDLCRRVVTGLENVPVPVPVSSLSPSNDPPLTRVELLHLPMRSTLVSATWASLSRAGYLPVGVRPHRRRTSEIVLQRVAAAHARESIASMTLAGSHVRALADGWLEACARTS